jgi:NADH dehydrogenase (ubiquinone) Fe-S protein 5
VRGILDAGGLATPNDPRGEDARYRQPIEGAAGAASCVAAPSIVVIALDCSVTGSHLVGFCAIQDHDMASGVGVNGGTGRCYPLWLGFIECMKDADTPSDCVDNREDYIECLHHRKEMSRMRRVYEEAKKQGRTPPDPSESVRKASEPDSVTPAR